MYQDISPKTVFVYSYKKSPRKKHFNAIFVTRNFPKNNFCDSYKKLSFHFNFCDKVFSQRHYLYILKQSHTGDKPFKYKFSIKSFTQNADLIKYKRSHRGEKALIIVTRHFLKNIIFFLFYNVTQEKKYSNVIFVS